jgi:predicted phosphate transport protein (TIGR00153 family)
MAIQDVIEWLLPREDHFYVLLEQQAGIARKAAKALTAFSSADCNIEELATAVDAIEKEGDRIVGELSDRLAQTFVTPIDREDIHGLAKSLDDVMDAIDAAAAVMRRYRMAQLRYGARELASLTWQSAMQVKVAVEALERKKEVHAVAVEVNRLENAADDIHDEALRRLFEEEKDAITLIKWKEVLDLLEEATDRCEDCANVLESVVVKHG